MTRQQLQILQFLNRGSWMFGREIMKGTEISSGSLYPALALLTSKGYVERRREDGDPHVLERPLRIHYRLTRQGMALSHDAPRRTRTPAASGGTK